MRMQEEEIRLKKRQYQNLHIHLPMSVLVIAPEKGKYGGWINFWASISIPQAIKKSFFMFTIVVLTVIRLLWDAEDVTIDAYLFYQLEMGGVIDNGIYRNGTVDKFVIPFSVLGCLKLLFWLRIIGAGRGVGMAEMLTGMPNGTKFLDPLKLLFAAVTFMF